MRGVALFASLCLLCSGVAGPSGAAEPGGGPASVADRQIALPAGSWRPVSARTLPLPAAGGAPIAQAAFLSVRSQKVAGIVVVQTNAEAGETGWGLPSPCTGEAAPLVAVAYDTVADGLCRFVATVKTGSPAGAAPAWTEALALAAAEGRRVSPVWLMAAVRLTTRQDVLDVRYLFPAGERDEAAPTPLFAWSRVAAEALPLGLKGRLDDAYSLPWPGDDPAASDPMAGWRLRQVKAMQDARLLDEAAVRDLIGRPTRAETAPAAADEGTVAWLNSLYRLATYRITGFLTSTGIYYAFLGDAGLSAGLYTLNATLSSALFYAHEMAWSAATGPDRTGRQHTLELFTVGVSP